MYPLTELVLFIPLIVYACVQARFVGAQAMADIQLNASLQTRRH
jgi:hypothetical protein